MTLQGMTTRLEPCRRRVNRTASCDRFARLPTVPEAPVRMSKNGLVVDGEGWFVVNARESRWKDEGPLGSYCMFEGKRRFPHFGINISVLEPGERIGMYHRENAQEAFLVLAGECTLIVGGRGAAAGRDGILPPRSPARAHHPGEVASSPRLSSLSVRADVASVAASSTRSARRRRVTELASCKKPRRPLHTRAYGRSSPAQGSSSTGAAGSKTSSDVACPANEKGYDDSSRPALRSLRTSRYQ